MAKKKATQKSPLTAEQSAEFALWHVLAYCAKKRAQRDAVAVGEQQVTATITATVDGVKLRQKLVGLLRVEPDTQAASSSTPELKRVVAALLAEIPKTRRRNLVESLKKATSAKPDRELIALAENLLSELRTTQFKPKRGAVTFEAVASAKK